MWVVFTHAYLTSLGQSYGYFVYFARSVHSLYFVKVSLLTLVLKGKIMKTATKFILDVILTCLSDPLLKTVQFVYFRYRSIFCQFGLEPGPLDPDSFVFGLRLIISFLLAVLETRLLLEQERMLIMKLEVLLLLEMVTS